MAKADAPAAPVAKPAAKPKAKKPKGSAAPTAPIEAPKPVAAESLDEAGSKKELDELQKRYAALVVNFNNQQTELQSCQTQLKRAEDELEVLRSSSAGSGGGGGDEKGLLEKMSAVRTPPGLPLCRLAQRLHLCVPASQRRGGGGCCCYRGSNQLSANARVGSDCVPAVMVAAAAIRLRVGKRCRCVASAAAAATGLQLLLRLCGCGCCGASCGGGCCGASCG